MFQGFQSQEEAQCVEGARLLMTFWQRGSQCFDEARPWNVNVVRRDFKWRRWNRQRGPGGENVKTRFHPPPRRACWKVRILQGFLLLTWASVLLSLVASCQFTLSYLIVNIHKASSECVRTGGHKISRRCVWWVHRSRESRRPRVAATRRWNSYWLLAFSSQLDVVSGVTRMSWLLAHIKGRKNNCKTNCNWHFKLCRTCCTKSFSSSWAAWKSIKMQRWGWSRCLLDCK